MKITKEVEVRYYVEEEDGLIYGGPFYQREEAEECLRKWKQKAAIAKAKEAGARD